MTLRRVSEKAGVAIDTVRKALRDDPTIRSYLKDRVLKAAEEIDYHPNLIARALREKNLQVVPISVIELENPYFGSLARHLSKCLADNGLEPALCLDAGHLLKLSRTLSPCGSILGYGYSEDHVRLLSKRQKVVNIGVQMKPMPGVGLVYLDFNPAYRDLISALKVKGCRRILLQSLTMSQYRSRGEVSGKFQSTLDALTESGLELVKRGTEEFFDDLGSILTYLESTPHGVDAIVCENDQVAALLYGELGRRGIRVPDDMMLAGCDGNLMLSGTFSIKIDTAVIAGESVGLLLSLLNGEKRNDPVIYSPVAVDSAGLPVS